jgi:nicotinate-nucleotide adenylyltransferase
MSSVGIIGGTFDPIHFGHLITARSVKEIRDLEKIIFIPCNISPHKKENSSENSFHRYQMIKQAVQKIRGFEVSDFEINNGGISYTIDTLNYFLKKYRDIELIIGFDNLLKFDSWKDPDEILTLTKLVVMKRKIDKVPTEKNKYYNNAIIVDTPLIEISATDIRNRVKEGLPIDFLVPETVKEYIYNFKLYRN